MLPNFRCDDLYSNQRERSPPQPVRYRVFCFFIKLAGVPHPGKRGRECTLGKAGTYEVPKLFQKRCGIKVGEFPLLSSFSVRNRDKLSPSHSYPSYPLPFFCSTSDLESIKF